MCRVLDLRVQTKVEPHRSSGTSFTHPCLNKDPDPLFKEPPGDEQ